MNKNSKFYIFNYLCGSRFLLLLVVYFIYLSKSGRFILNRETVLNEFFSIVFIAIPFLIILNLFINNKEKLKKIKFIVVFIIFYEILFLVFRICFIGSDHISSMFMSCGLIKINGLSITFILIVFEAGISQLIYNDNFSIKNSKKIIPILVIIASIFTIRYIATFFIEQYYEWEYKKEKEILLERKKELEKMIKIRTKELKKNLEQINHKKIRIKNIDNTNNISELFLYDLDTKKLRNITIIGDSNSLDAINNFIKDIKTNEKIQKKFDFVYYDFYENILEKNLFEFTITLNIKNLK